MTHPIKNHSKIFHKALRHTVTQLTDNHFMVTSGDSGETYHVSLSNLSCSCPRQDYIGSLRNGRVNACSHVQAVAIYILDKDGYSLTPRPGNAKVDNLHRLLINMLGGDNVVFTARKDVKARRQLRNEIVDDRSTADRQIDVAEKNARLLDLDPEMVEELQRILFG